MVDAKQELTTKCPLVTVYSMQLNIRSPLRLHEFVYSEDSSDSWAVFASHPLICLVEGHMMMLFFFFF